MRLIKQLLLLTSVITSFTSCSRENASRKELRIEEGKPHPLTKTSYINSLIDDEYKHGYYFIKNRQTEVITHAYKFHEDNLLGWVYMEDTLFDSSHVDYRKVISQEKDSITVEIGFEKGYLGDIYAVIGEFNEYYEIADTIAVIRPEEGEKYMYYTFSKKQDTLEYKIIDRVYIDPVNVDSVRRFFTFPLLYKIAVNDLLQN